MKADMNDINDPISSLIVSFIIKLIWLADVYNVY